ncbi:metallophosphoesterase [Chitinophaga sp.]|uniref:metallophosphoesterase family protein n=1 Tax=Chitinophaga sp. TaxID=1869181 RepID=UPI002602F699|nr:metallophosphoesterase [uncultured Chitinophaga sp.]
MINRRDFIGLSLKSIVLIGAGSALQSFTPGSFALPPRKKVKLRFALASDGHYGQPDTSFVAHHDNMVALLNKEASGRGLDFTVINGDVFHNDPKLIHPAKAAWDKLSMQYHVSHGNHDMIDESEWEKVFGTRWHYDFKQGDNAFLVLNTADVKGKYVCPDLDWTREHLARHRNAKNLFVIQHITPVKWTEHGIDCPELVEMFSAQPNLRAVFHGHDHAEDGMKEKNGKHYFFDGHLGGSWGKPYYGYRIVEVLRSGEVLCYQVNPAQEAPVNSTTVKR